MNGRKSPNPSVQSLSHHAQNTYSKAVIAAKSASTNTCQYVIIIFFLYILAFKTIYFYLFFALSV